MAHKAGKVLQPPPEGINLGNWAVNGNSFVHSDAFIGRHAHMSGITLLGSFHNNLTITLSPFGTGSVNESNPTSGQIGIWLPGETPHHRLTMYFFDVGKTIG